jgi:hypothetical protein
MLNYNINIIGGAMGKFSGGVRDASINWQLVLDPTAFSVSTFNIGAPNSNAINITQNGATGSFDVPGTFVLDPSYFVVSSLTASLLPVTGSTTMSIFINGAPATQLRMGTKTGNLPLTSGSVVSCSFAPAADTLYEIKGDITHNRANESTASINWNVSGSNQASSQFNIKKDATVVMATSSLLSTASGTFNNLYALNLTASLNSKDYIWYSSSSFKQITQSLIIPELGINLVSYTTGSDVTASWVAQSATASYNITSSVLLKPFDPYTIDEYIMIGGGGAGGAGFPGASGGGGGAGGVVSGSGLVVKADSIYQVTIGLGGDATTVPSNGAASLFTTSSGVDNLIVAAGGGGGVQNNQSGQDGGSGGGASGPNSGGTTLASYASGSYLTNITGSRGGRGSSFSQNQNTFYTAGAGGGATGVGSNVPFDGACVGGAAGGTGLSDGLPSILGLITGSYAYGGDGGGAPSGCSGGGSNNGANAPTLGGAGGGGGRNASGGTGGNGLFILKYLGTQKGRGGSVTYDGTYTYHTFTSSGLFYSTANVLPDYQ